MPYDATPSPEQAALHLRSLRFPGELERAFRDDYHQGSISYIRWLAALLSLLGVLAFLREAVAPEFGRQALVVWASRCVLFGSLSLCTLRPEFFRRYAQAIIAAVLLGTQVCAHLAGILIDDVATRQSAERYFEMVCFSNVEVVGFYVMFRLRLVPAALVAWLSIGAHVAAHRWILGVPAAWWGMAALLFLNANLVGMLAGWFGERSARRDFLLRRLLEREQQRSDALLQSILPGSVAERLKAGARTIADSFAEVTVLFADIVGFTPLAARRRPEDVVDLLNDVFTEFDRLAERHGLEKIKTIGDAYMVVGGLPDPRPDHAIAVAEMALDMRDALRRLSEKHGESLHMRFGINSGPVVAGVIGRRRFLYDLWGDTVNLASRMESQAVADCIYVTPESRALLGGAYDLQELAPAEVKGRGEMRPFLLRGRRGHQA